MVEKDIQILHKEVEKALFEDFHKILDRYYSLIYLLFVLAGFTVTVLNITLNKEHETIQDVLSNYHIIFSFTFLFIGFLIAISCMLKTSQYKSLVKKDEVIKFRDQDELINSNVKLYSTITKLKDFYIITISLMVLSFGALLNYFAKIQVLSILFPIGLVIELALTIHESHR